MRRRAVWQAVLVAFAVIVATMVFVERIEGVADVTAVMLGVVGLYRRTPRGARSL